MAEKGRLALCAARENYLDDCCNKVTNFSVSPHARRLCVASGYALRHRNDPVPRIAGRRPRERGREGAARCVSAPRPAGARGARGLYRSRRLASDARRAEQKVFENARRLARDFRHAGFGARRYARLGARAARDRRLSPPVHLPRPRLSRRHRLYGPGQLGDGARRRLEIRHGAALRRRAVQPHGDRAAIADGAARPRRRPRSRQRLPRAFSAHRLFGALAAGRGGHSRDRSRRGHRHGDRPAIAVRPAARRSASSSRCSTLSSCSPSSALGFRKIELFVVAMLGIIALSFGGAAGAGASPISPRSPPASSRAARCIENPEMLYIGLGILGATVMPHNLFLHSYIVQTRAVGASLGGAARGDRLRHVRQHSGAAVRARHQRLDPGAGGRRLPRHRPYRGRRARRGLSR